MRSTVQPIEPLPEQTDPHRWIGWLAVFIVALVFYGVSASPDIQWQDSGQFALDTVTGKMDVDFGLCTAHPLHFWICLLFARALPVSAPLATAWVSALGGAITIANVFGIVRTLSNNVRAALLAAAGLMVANTFWRFSCYTEVYSLTAGLLTAEFWAVALWDVTRRPKWIALCFLANGVGLANHDLALLTLPVIGIVFLIAAFRKEIWVRTGLVSAIAWFAGASIFLVMIIQEARHDGWPEAIRSALVGHWSGAVEGKSLVWLYPATSVAFTLLSFPNLMLPACVLGIIRARRLPMRPLSYWALLASLGMHLAFVFRYNVIDQYTFLEPAYALGAVFVGVAIAYVNRTWTAKSSRLAIGLMTVSVVLTPFVYPVAEVVTRRFNMLGHYVRNKPYRDDYRYLFIPWGRGERSAQLMSADAVSRAGTDGLIIAQDLMGAWAIQYQLLIAGRSNVELSEEQVSNDLLIKHAREGKAVVLVPYTADVPPPAPPVGRWKRDGQLFMLDLSPGKQP